MSAIAEKQTLVIVGASVRSAAQRASLLGLNLVAIDQFGDRDLKSVAQVHPLHSILDPNDANWESWWQETRGQTPLLLCGGMENRTEVIDRLMIRGLDCGVSSAMLAELRAPESWARWAAETGLLWPETYYRISDIPEKFLCDEQRRGKSWLVKSRVTAGGLGVREWEGDSWKSWEYLQTQIAGDVIGVTFVNQKDESYVVGGMKNWTEDSFPGPSPFIYRGNVGPLPLEFEEQKRLQEFANRVRQATGMKGVWQADFVRNQEGWWLLEINPRWSSSMELLEIAYGVSLVAQHVAAVMGTPVSKTHEIEWELHASRCTERTRFSIGKAVRYALGALNPDPAMLDRWWDKRWDGTAASIQKENRLADIPGETATIPDGYPICTEYAVAISMDEVRDRLRSSVIAADL